MEEQANSQVAPQIQQPTQTPSGMPQMVIIAGVVVLMVLIGVGGYYLGTKQQLSSNKHLSQQTITPTVVPSITVMPTQSTQNIRPDNFSLANVWQLGTTEYSNPAMNITFQYPTSFVTTVFKIQTLQNIPKPIYSFSVHTPDVPIETRQKPGFDFNNYDANTMAVSIDVYQNINSQSLETFMSELYQGISIDGKTPLITRLKQDLSNSNIPKPGSFVYIGGLGENPEKIYYFSNKDVVYVFTLTGGNNTGESYTKEAESVFTNIINSIKFN